MAFRWMLLNGSAFGFVLLCLGLVGMGFVVARFALFLEEIHAPGQVPAGKHEISLQLGVAIVVVGVAISLVAAVLHARELRRLLRGEPFRPSIWSFAIAVAVGIGLAGLALAYRLLTSPR